MKSTFEHLTLTVTLCLALYLCGHTEAQCNSTAVDECLSRYSNVSTNFNGFKMNGSDIDPNCNSYNDLVNCINTLAGCKDTDRYFIINWLGAKNAYNYICKDGRTDYLAKQACLSNGTYQQVIKNNNCNVDPQPVRNNYTTDLAEKACSEYTSALNCRQAAAQSVCQAGDFIRKLYTIQFDVQTKIVAPACTGQCNFTALEDCVKVYRPSGDGMYGSTLNATQLGDACKLYNSTNECVKLTKCSDSDTITQAKWLGYRGLAEYTCGEGKTGYLSSQGCLSNSTYVNARSQCPPAPSTATSTPDQVCQGTIAQLACFNNITESRCGKDAMTYLSRAIPRYTAPYVTSMNPNCKIPIPSSSNNAMGIVYSTLALMMSLLVAALL